MLVVLKLSLLLWTTFSSKKITGSSVVEINYFPHCYKMHSYTSIKECIYVWGVKTQKNDLYPVALKGLQTWSLLTSHLLVCPSTVGPPEPYNLCLENRVRILPLMDQQLDQHCLQAVSHQMPKYQEPQELVLQSRFNILTICFSYLAWLNQTIAITLSSHTTVVIN